MRSFEDYGFIDAGKFQGNHRRRLFLNMMWSLSKTARNKITPSLFHRKAAKCFAISPFQGSYISFGSLGCSLGICLLIVSIPQNFFGLSFIPFSFRQLFELALSFNSMEA